MMLWLEENKEPIIPPEVVDDIDNDYEIQIKKDGEMDDPFADDD